jgi:hypothetical protein
VAAGKNAKRTQKMPRLIGQIQKHLEHGTLYVRVLLFLLKQPTFGYQKGTKVQNTNGSNFFIKIS